MRIVFDMQGAQAENRNRGIGKYSASIVHQLAKDKSSWEIFIVLNSAFEESIFEIRNGLKGIVPEENVKVWHNPLKYNYLDSGDCANRTAAELIREAFISNLKPDIVFITSVFEGLADNAVVSIGNFKNATTVAILYDLIPLIRKSTYLDNPIVNKWYNKQLNYLRRANLLLSISDSSRQEAIDHLGISQDHVVNISTAVEKEFKNIVFNKSDLKRIENTYQISKPFLMYTGGIDHRKNIETLIEAYASLSADIKIKHQLVIVCSILDNERERLLNVAINFGLDANEVIFTGYVSKEDLISLYNSCKGFVFPSLHEGFGLPVLEAMSCGKAVIASNSSSIPEVVGYSDALFDPNSVLQITKKISQILTDELFRNKLELHAIERSKIFSWENTALKASKAIEGIILNQSNEDFSSKRPDRRKRLAYISPLPPLKSGISDYSAELIPELSKYYEIEVILNQTETSNQWINEHCAIRSLEWFQANFNQFDRVLYHFGNSPFHQHMFELIKQIPGVLVLHDFFLSGIIAHMELHGNMTGYWSRELFASHGYKALLDRSQNPQSYNTTWIYPCNLSVIQAGLGVIVHSQTSFRLAKEWYGKQISDWAIIPLLRDSEAAADKESARSLLGYSSNDFLVCSFGMLGPTKLNNRLLQAWLNSGLASDKSCHLVFVGENPPGEYGSQLDSQIKNNNLADRIKITGWVDAKMYRTYLSSADLSVQLRTLSRGESSAAVHDCMNYGCATIVNSNGSLADLPNDCVWKMPDEFSDEQLTSALEKLKSDQILRSKIGTAAREVINLYHSPKKCTQMYFDAIENFYSSSASGLNGLVDSIAELPAMHADYDIRHLSKSIANSFPQKNKKRQLLVDISELVQRDSKSGIQRVVRSILWHWLLMPPFDYRIEPIYAEPGKPGYRYARKFTINLLGISAFDIKDDPIEFFDGDIFLGLDLQHHIVKQETHTYTEMKIAGVKVNFLVYDLLPVLMPHFFINIGYELHNEWLKSICESDRVFCISQSVASELNEWVNAQYPQKAKTLAIDWFHLGADVENSLPSNSLPDDARDVLNKIEYNQSFVMVGTLEPRKGHAQVLDAFEILWQDGSDTNLVIVGKQGWLVDELCEKIRSHPELNNRLFWLEGISDEYLEKVYAASSCLIAASYGEGFGLPLIEAAQKKIPILVRDIPVFREVAGEHAAYFTADTPQQLAQAIQNWIRNFQAGTHPKSDHMPYLTWMESAKMLLQKVCKGAIKRESQKIDPVPCAA